MELDAGLLEKDLDGFHARIRGAYAAAHQAVHDELARLQAPGDSDAGVPSPTQARAGRHGHAAQYGNGQSTRAQGERSRVPRTATPSQVKAILAIARRQNTDLPRLLRQEHEVSKPEALTIRQASELIDRLKSSRDTV
jgi:hypothetical protein